MRFWLKLNLSIVLMIALILSCSRWMIVRQNFRYAVENSIEQNTNQYRLEKYSLETNMINQIQIGEEITDEKMVQAVEAMYAYLNSSGKMAIFDKNKQTIFCNFEAIGEVNLEEIFYSEVDTYCVREIGDKQYLLFGSFASINNKEIYLVNFYDISVIYQMRNRQLKEILYVDMMVLVIASICISIFSKFLTRPIEKLNEASKKISSGKFKERVEVKTNDEIQELAESFNKMAEEIEHKIDSLQSSIQAKDDFITGFSHEIKTPMTAIIGYADLLRLKKCDEKVTVKALDYIYSEAKRLEELSYKLLSLMKLSEDKIELQTAKIDESIRKMISKIPLEKIEIMLDLQKAVVKIDESLIEVVIRNLVENAKKAEPKDKVIKIKGEMLANGKYRISVIDQGKGIPEEHIGRVTEDFYMVDKARSRQNGGTGIGLSLCQKILGLHHSKIEIESKENIGTKVYFELEGQSEI